MTYLIKGNLAAKVPSYGQHSQHHVNRITICQPHNHVTSSSQSPSSSSWEVSAEACEEKRVKTLSGVNPWFFSSSGCRQKKHEWHLAHYLLIRSCTSQLQHFIAFCISKTFL
jgi:hypothetical protein